MREIKWKVDIGQKFKDNKRDLVVIDRKIINKKIACAKCISGYTIRKIRNIKYHCNKCGNEDFMVESELLRGTGCNVCCNRKITEINCVSTTYPNITKYLLNKEDGKKYSCKSVKRVLCKCPDCGYIEKYSIKNIVDNGFRCKLCGDTNRYPNKVMGVILSYLNIDFKSEYSPEWTNGRRYDFYLPDYNLIIEMDGGWHTKDNNLSGVSCEKSKEIDEYKDLKAKEHGIEVVRIDCNYGHDNRFEYIKSNLINSKLNNILKLDMLNLSEITSICENNIVKEVCDYWRNHVEINKEDIGVTLISSIFNKNRSTIIDYLHRGNSFGWCNYNGKEELNKSNSKFIFSSTCKKPIKILKDGKLVGKFESSMYVQRNSNELFGEFLKGSNIQRVARGERKTYKGYNIYYITKEEYDEYVYENKGVEI